MIGTIARAVGHDPALQRLTPYQRAALDDIAACGTVACGTHVQACDHCGAQRRMPNTCGNRSCPHCQGRQRAAWVEDRLQELLPCGYFHAVLTLPPSLRGLAATAPTVVLNALMTAAGTAIDDLCRDPRYLGGMVGQLMVLHTWTRNLHWHPHVHVIVTAGGYDPDRQRWIPARVHGRQRRGFLVPVNCLKAAFHGRLLALLGAAVRAGDLDDIGQSRPALQTLLHQCRHCPVVVRIEPPFGGPVQLMKYLGRYVNRVAIAPGRVDFDQAVGTVHYTWRSNREPDRDQETILPAVEFLARFAQHVLPPRFHRIRFRGLWATAHRARLLHVVQRLLGGVPPSARVLEPTLAPVREQDRCPFCKQGMFARLPGPCPRPSRWERRRLLQEIRLGRLAVAPQEAPICA